MDQRVAVACLTVATCVGLSAAATPLHPLLGLAGLVGVALGAASALDDEASAVTDATPRPVRRRILERAPSACLPLLTWLGATLLLEQRRPDWEYAFGAALGLCVAVGAFGAAALARKHGIATPGEPAGTALGGLVLTLLLGGPSIRGVSPFAPTPEALLWWMPLLVAGAWALRAGARDRMLTPPRRWRLT